MDAVGDDELLAATPARPEAFAAFYRRHERLVLGYFMRRTRNAELAADLTAETFAAALDTVRRFDAARGPALAWLFGIARNQLRRAHEKRRVEDRARRRLGIPPTVLDDDALERIQRLGEEARVVALLDLLPADQRHAVRARVIDERPYEQIAAEIRCSPSVVRQRVSRGLNTLRTAIRRPQ
jgi:RNA polymerase sigma factor (sigma-70 family)